MPYSAGLLSHHKTEKRLADIAMQSSPLHCPSKLPREQQGAQGQILTFRNSLCTAPITLRRAAQGRRPHPHHSSFPLPLKIFLSSVRLLRYFPEDCCWIDWALIARPRRGSGWNFTFASSPHFPLPRLSEAAAALGDFRETAISDSLSLSLYCLHVDTPAVGQLICIYSRYPLSAF